MLRTEGRGLSDSVRSTSVLSPQSSVLDGLAALVDQSLLRQDESADGEPRFTMLETIREYALERLAASGEEEAIRQRHAAYFLALAEAAEPELRGAQAEQLASTPGRPSTTICVLRSAGIENMVRSSSSHAWVQRCGDSGGVPACGARDVGGWIRRWRAALRCRPHCGREVCSALAG